MKNIIIKLLLVLSLISFSWINYVSNTYAAEGTVKVIVTEQIPWAWCEMIDDNWNKTTKKRTDWKTQMYQCEIKKWFWSVISMLWNIIKYFTFIASLWAVLFIIINGILYSMWGAEPSMKDDAKKRIIWTLVWLILLLLSWVILNLVAPWIYK
jgi:hypothetical protein